MTRISRLVVVGVVLACVALGAIGAILANAALTPDDPIGRRGVVACDQAGKRCWQQGRRVASPHEGDPCAAAEDTLSTTWGRGSDFPTDPYYRTFSCMERGSGPE